MYRISSIEPESSIGYQLAELEEDDPHLVEKLNELLDIHGSCTISHEED